ncbi:MAG: hypothetical protein K6U80_18305, partial [Firmicutes bacterium]|nr:hypothetical protein [Bacillota bacterium]
GGRWYEPGIGRWVTVDPAEDGENWYGYCDQNPISSKDRDGFYTGTDDLGVFLGGAIAGAGIEFVSQLWHRKYDVTRLFTAFLKGGLSAWVGLYTGPGGLAVYSFLDAVEEGVRAKLAGQGWTGAFDVYARTFATDMITGLIGGVLGKGIAKVAGKLAPKISQIISKFKGRYVKGGEVAHITGNDQFMISVTNPNGRKGCPAHQELIKYLEDNLKKLGYKVKTEYYVKDIVGGYKNARFADLHVYNPSTGLEYLIQVGKTTKAGIPVARELKAIYDLQLKGWLVKFFSYN